MADADQTAPGTPWQDGLLAAWLAAAGLIGVWAWAAKPWAPGEVTAGGVAVLSLAAALAFTLAGRRAETRAKAQGRPKSNFGLFPDVALAFWIMTASAFVFAALNSYVAAQVDPEVEGRTVAAVLDAQARFSGLLAWMKSAKLALRIAAFILLGGGAILALGGAKAFDRLLAGRKTVSKGLRIVTLAGICAGSFALAGSTVGEGVQVALSHTFKFGAVNRAPASLVQAVARELIAAPVDEAIVRADPCLAQARRRGCYEPLGDLESELQRTASLQEEWPARAREVGLPDAPPSQATHDSASALARDLAGTEEALRAVESVGPEPGDSRLETLPLSAIGDAENALAEPEAATDIPMPDPQDKRLRDLLGLAIGVGLDLLPVQLEPHLKGTMGVFTDKVASSITGAVRGRFEEAVRDTAFDLAKGCAAAPASCRELVKARMVKARSDPRVQAAQAQIVSATTPLVRRVVEPRARLRDARRDTNALLDAAAAPRLKGETLGPWAESRRNWEADLRAGRLGGDHFKPDADPRAPRPDNLAPSQREEIERFLRDWSRARRALAIEMRRDGTPDTAQTWNQAFLTYANQHPRFAATFAFMVVKDRTLLAALKAERPREFVAPRNAYDAYRLFAADAKGRSWTDRPAEMVLFHQDFGHALQGRFPEVHPAGGAVRDPYVDPYRPHPEPPRPRPRVMGR